MRYSKKNRIKLQHRFSNDKKLSYVYNVLENCDTILDSICLHSFEREHSEKITKRNLNE